MQSDVEAALKETFLLRLHHAAEGISAQSATSDSPHSASHAATQRLEQTIERAQRLIRHDCAAHWTVEAVARKVGCNRTDLERGFRRRSGLTVHEFVVSCRMAAAKHQLRSCAWRLEEVARSVGFHSKVSMYAHFRRSIGMTPAQYRQRWQPTETNEHVRRLVD